MLSIQSGLLLKVFSLTWCRKWSWGYLLENIAVSWAVIVYLIGKECKWKSWHGGLGTPIINFRFKYATWNPHHFFEKNVTIENQRGLLQQVFEMSLAILKTWRTTQNSKQQSKNNSNEISELWPATLFGCLADRSSRGAWGPHRKCVQAPFVQSWGSLHDGRR